MLEFGLMPIRSVVSRLCKHLSLKDLPYRPCGCCFFLFHTTSNVRKNPIQVCKRGRGRGRGGGGGGGVDHVTWRQIRFMG